MPLRITTQNVLIGINITKGQMNIKQLLGDQRIKYDIPKAKIDFDLPRVMIDQSQCLSEIGLKGYVDLARKIAQRSMQKALEGIGKMAEEGDRMALIGNDIPPAIPEIAKKNLSEEIQYNIDIIPKSRPKIEFVGDINIDWQLGKANIEYKVNKPNINFKRGNVDIYLKQKGNVDIQYIDQKI